MQFFAIHKIYLTSQSKFNRLPEIVPLQEDFPSTNHTAYNCFMCTAEYFHGSFTSSVDRLAVISLSATIILPPYHFRKNLSFGRRGHMPLTIRLTNPSQSNLLLVTILRFDLIGNLRLPEQFFPMSNFNWNFMLINAHAQHSFFLIIQ